MEEPIEIIEAANSLTVSKWKKFIKQLTDDEKQFPVIVDNVIEFIDKEHPEKMFENEKLLTTIVDKNQDIYFIGNNISLHTIGLDYLWYKGRPDRIAKLFKLDNKPKAVKQSQTTSDISVACAVRKDGQILDVSSFVGNIKSAIQFLNDSYRIKLAKSFFKDEVVFCINYTEDSSEWFTFEELQEKGVFSV